MYSPISAERVDASRGAAILEDAVEGTKVVARVEKAVTKHVTSAPDQVIFGDNATC